MSDSTQRPRRKSGKNSYTTRSGKTIKLNRSMGQRMRAGREARAQRKAAYLSTLPKEPWKRLLYRLHPRRLYKYWFSRDGAIMALKVAGIGFVVIFLLLVGLFAYFRKDLPAIKNLSGGNFGGSITYYDRTGKTVLFQDYDAVKRVPVEQKEISKYMQQATIAVEDKDFYHEGAFNVKGILRAAINDATGGSTQGGSTITQQLVKLNEGWTNDHTVGRKVKELILAVELEREYSKDDILTAYLNIAPYGNVDYGVQSAAQDYFHVDASQLSLAQSAMLASIPKAPGSYSPFSSPQFNPSLTENGFDSTDLITRQHYVLNLMAEQGYITQKQADAAKQVDVLAQVQQLQSHYAGIKAPYFVLAVRQQLLHEFPAAVVKTGGWKVITTLDMNLQNLADKAVNNAAGLLARQHADEAAFVAEDNATGQIMALVGGTDFNNPLYGQNNFATDAKISPGSSIKPYTYTALINDNNNVGAGSVLYDTQGPLPGYPCTDKSRPDNDPTANCLWDDTRSYSGPETLRYALGGSLNVPAVKAFLSTDPKDTSTSRIPSINNSIATVNALMDNPDGYKCYKPNTNVATDTKADETQCGGAAGIGDGAYLTLADHVNGIASIARLGQSIPQTFILKVTNASGQVLKKFEQPKGKQVVKADSAYIVSDMAADPGASYLSGSCNSTTCSGMKFHRYKGWHNAIKTGTTNDLTDGLMMSWNAKYTAGVWVGNYNRKPYTGQPEYMTDPIMKTFMQGAIDNLGDAKPQNWTQPTDIKTEPAYVLTHVPFRAQTAPSPRTDLFPSWYVGKTTQSSRTIDKVSGLIATSCTPAAAQEASYNSAANQWNVDIFAGGHPSSGSSTTSGSAPTATDNVHSCSDSPPTVTITAINDTPTSGSATPECPQSGCVVMVHVEQGTHPLTDSNYPDYPGTLQLIVNGQAVQSKQVNSTGDYQFTYVPPAGSSGSVQVEAEVTDSVLYQGTDTKTLNVQAPSSTPTTGGGGGGNGGPKS